MKNIFEKSDRVNKDFPLVSIIIPVYNGANFLKKAIDSALNQTYKNIEILVINDGSNDNGKTEEISLNYGDKIRYIQKQNGGVSSALNVGIKEMKGEYFSWLSHDDEYTETKIERQINCLRLGGDIAVCNERQIDENSCFLSKSNDYSFNVKHGIFGWQDEIVKIISDRLFSGCALLIPKYVFDSVGFFDESLRYTQDFDMWLRICLKKYSWVYNNDVGVLSRVHNNQVTQTRKDLFFTDSYKLAKVLIPQLLESSSKEYNYLFLYAKHCAKYNLGKNIEFCIRELKNNNLVTFKEICILKILIFYGKIRPLIRRVYYKIFKKVKTQ